jgi:PAS domain S-box-containing protein
MLIELDDLRNALKRDELIPHFQPLVELRTGRIHGFEVLARWDHPIHGPFLPSNLIHLAEAHGLIGGLSRQVFSKAFATAPRVPEPMRLSMNLSPLQLSDPGIAGAIEAMAHRADFDLRRLTLEITESALLSDLENAVALAHTLKTLGCQLSLDDFGTGYSSMAHLHALPFDELKIDRSFVSLITKRRESRKIVTAILGLGHSLGLRTVAEGIETQEEADLVMALGGELGQGWVFGRPAACETFRGKAFGRVASAGAKPAISQVALAASSLEAFPTQRLAQLQAIYDGAPVGLCFVDSGLRYVSINKRLAEMNGAPVAEHIGKPMSEMLAGVCFEEAAPYLARALRGEAISGVEVRRPRGKSSTEMWAMCSYQPAFDEAGEVVGISISVLDITEYRKAQEDLREGEILHRHLVDLSRHTLWAMDAKGNNLQVSSSWMQAEPLEKRYRRHLGWLKAIHRDDVRITIAKIRKAMRTGEPIDLEYRVQNAEGEWRWVRSRGTPQFGPDGEITRWYGSVEDIHERKRAEIQNARRAANLEQLLEGLPGAVVAAQGEASLGHPSSTV